MVISKKKDPFNSNILLRKDSTQKIYMIKRTRNMITYNNI